MSLTGALAKKERKPAQGNGATVPIVVLGGSAYGRAALEREADELRSTPEGERNDRLNRAAFAVGQLVAGGQIDEADATRSLRGAALACGLDELEIGKTMVSGLEAGKKEPRMPPPRESTRVRSGNGAANDNHDDGPGPDDYGVDDLMDPSLDPDEPVSLPDRNGEDPAVSVASGPKKPLLEVVYSDALFAPLEEPSYVVDTIVRRASLTEIVSYGGSGKTWLATNMMIALGAGVPWLGRFETKAGKVIGLDYENGIYEMRRRLKANARALGFDAVPGIGLVSMPQLYMYDPKFETNMLTLADGCDLGIIDTLKAGNPGVDENDSNMRTGLDTLRRVAEKTNTGFVVLVHAKKTSGSVTTVDPREAGRGSSAIYDAADTVLHVMYTEGKPLRVSQTKARLGRPVPPFQVEITDGNDGAVHVVASDIPRDDTTAADRFEAACMRVLEAVRANPGHARPVYRETIGMRNQVVTAALERLAKDGAVRNVGTKKEPKWFPAGGGGGRDD